MKFIEVEYHTTQAQDPRQIELLERLTKAAESFQALGNDITTDYRTIFVNNAFDDLHWRNRNHVQAAAEEIDQWQVSSTSSSGFLVSSDSDKSSGESSDGFS